MNVRSLIVVLALSFFTNLLFAQNYTFKVLVSKGKTEIKSSNSWQSIKVGASLKPTDEIKISENAYLGLIHANGKPLEIKEAGSHKVSELVSKLSPGSSVLNKYTDFILSSEQQKKNRLSATGAVHRGLPKDMIVVYLPETERSQVYGDKITIQWASENGKSPYEVIFTSLLDDELGKYETNDNKLSVNLGEGNFKSEYEIMVKVISKDKRGVGSKDYIIKKLRPSDREKIAGLATEVTGSMDQQSALSKYIMAGFYEENFLLIDALTAYQDAAALAPDVELYKTAYNDFLKRMEFKK